MTISTLGLTGARCASLQEITLSGNPDWFDGALARLNNDGYAVVEGAVPAVLCRQLSDELEAAVARTGSTRPPNFEGAGWRVGHLNAHTGPLGAALQEAIEAAGFPALVNAAMGQPTRLISVCSNINLPGSLQQVIHVDGPADRPFVVVNVALTETDSESGATELVPGSHAVSLRYWQLLREPWVSSRVRPTLSPGDVIVRHSGLWHRGMPNRTDRVRPLAALIFLSEAAEQLDFHHPQDTRDIQLFGNGYTGRFGTARELLAARAPWVEHWVRVGRSLR